jgi:hypothetical protein
VAEGGPLIFNIVSYPAAGFLVGPGGGRRDVCARCANAGVLTGAIRSESRLASADGRGDYFLRRRDQIKPLRPDAIRPQVPGSGTAFDEI